MGTRLLDSLKEGAYQAVKVFVGVLIGVVLSTVLFAILGVLHEVRGSFSPFIDLGSVTNSLTATISALIIFSTLTGLIQYLRLGYVDPLGGIAFIISGSMISLFFIGTQNQILREVFNEYIQLIVAVAFDIFMSVLVYLIYERHH